MKHMPTKNGVIGLVLSCSLILNFLPLFGANVAASTDPYNISGKIDLILSKALDWIENNQKQSGGWGDERLVNDTAYSVYSLRRNDRANASGTRFLTEFDVDENTDTLSHILSATGLEAQYVAKLLSHQNSDNGFGLNMDYSSEAYDTVLALEALEEINNDKHNDTIKKIVLYLLAHQNKDGSWSGNEYNDGNTAFTARAAYAISKYLTENHLTSDSVVSAFAKTNSFLSSVSATDVSQKGLQAALYKQMVRHLNDDYTDVYQTVEAIEEAQKGNGSFYDDIYDTYLVIKYLNSLDTIEDSCTVESFDVAVDNNTFTVNQEGKANGKYTVNYKTALSKEMTIVTKLYDSENKEVVSQEAAVKLDFDKETAEGDAFSFDINEAESKVLKVVSTLYDGNEEVYGCTGYLYVQEKPVVPDTKVTDAGLTLSESYGFVNEPKEVTSGIYMLYATNVIRRLAAKTTVTCNGAIIANEETEIELTPDKSELILDTTKLTINESSAKTYHYKTEFRSGDTLWYTAEKDYTVFEKPEDVQNENKITQFSLSLDDYCAYASNSTQIVKASCNMLYSVYQDIKVTIKGSILDGEEVIYTSENAVELSPGNTDQSFDLIEGELDLSTAKLYTFKAELFDKNGDPIGETTEQFKVIARPDMELILSVDTNTGDKYSANFSWNDISNEYEQYGYHLLRSTDNGKTWESRSSWDGEKVKVLNVYPISYAKNYLVDWMNMIDPETSEPAGKGLFEIDTVYIDDLNRTPDNYLKDETGNYKYDVLMFGTYDANNFKDISESALKSIQSFINSGRGVLFGHDTACIKNQTVHPNFASFDKQLGIIVENDNASYIESTRVNVVNEGFLTSFPWKISGTLSIPSTHCYGQKAGGTLSGTVWMKLVNAANSTDPETGATNDFYLVTNNNLAMIQTGHSNGRATIDECKVFANTMFYLKQATSSGASVDNSFYDEAAPGKPEAKLSLTGYQKNEYSIDAKLSAQDFGSDYRYRVEALPKSGLSDKVLSNTVMTSAISELCGFVAFTTDSEESAASKIEYDTDGKTPLNIINAENGSAVYEMKNLKKNKKYYLHVFAFDNANNISEEYIKEIYDNEEVLLQTGINSSLTSDKPQYEIGKTVTLTAESYTTGSSLNAKADITLEKLDGTPVTIIAENINRQLTSKARWSEDYTMPSENIPVGKYMAVLRWRIDDTVVAESKCLVKIIEYSEESELKLKAETKEGADYSNTLTWTDMNNGGESGYIPTDFSVVVDCSGSMSGDRIKYAKEAVNRFIKELNDGDRMNLIAFENNASLLHDFSDNKNSLLNAAAKLWANGGTQVNSGLNLATDCFEKDNIIEDHYKAIVLVCDGDVNDCSEAVNFAVEHDVTIYTVNVVNADSSYLQNIASQTGGQYFYTNIVYDMAEILQRIRVANDKGDYYYEVIRDGEMKGVYSRPKYPDGEFLDKASPAILSTQLFSNEINDNSYSGRIVVKASDFGTDYEYAVNAVDTHDKEHVVYSNKVTVVAISDIKGFVYSINRENEPCPEIAYDESLFISSGNELTIDIENYTRGEIYYLHVFAVDNNDNYSEETVYRFVVGKPMFESTNVTTSVKTDRESYNIGDTVYPDVTARTDYYKVFAKGVIEITDSDYETVEVIEPSYVVEIPSYEDLNKQFAWEAKDVAAGDYYATVKWYDGDTLLASDSAPFTILPNGEINDRLRTDKVVYSVGENIELSDYIFNNTTNTYANDLDITIDIMNQHKETVQTVEGTASIMAGKTGLFTDSLSAGTLGEGTYQAVSSVMFDNKIVASSSTGFEVTDDEINFSGKIIVNNYDARSKQFDYSVTNKNDNDIKGTTVRVKVYSESGEVLSTIDKKADFAANETKNFHEIYNTEKLTIGNYPIALSVLYGDKEGVLDESGFVISEMLHFTVTFVNEDGTVIETQEVTYGESAKSPETPKKISDEKYDYIFDGWDKDFSIITSDLTVTAKYRAVEKKPDATSAVIYVPTPDEVVPTNTTPGGKTIPKTTLITQTPSNSIQTGQTPYILISVFTLIAVYGVLVFFVKKNQKEKEDK